MAYSNADKLRQVINLLQEWGIATAFSSGWSSRGHGEMNPVWGVAHHTASSGNALGVVRDGRSGLPGPLSQFHLSRTGLVTLVAAGLAYHAGRGEYPDGKSGNYWSIGIEADNRGTGEPWPAVQLNAYYALCAAICEVYGWPASRWIGHKEYTSRKIDPYGINMDDFRRKVANYHPGTTPTPSTPKKDWFDMASINDLKKALTEVLEEDNFYRIREGVRLILTGDGAKARAVRKHIGAAVVDALPEGGSTEGGVSAERIAEITADLLSERLGS